MFQITSTKKLIQLLKPNLLFILIYYSFIIDTSAQQTPQYSQYMVNPIVINPAITGVENYIDATVAHRNQWVGFEGAPNTGVISLSAPLGLLSGKLEGNPNTSHSGIGAFIYTDTAGPNNLSGYFISYAYHLKVSENWFVSLGSFLGYTQFRFDDDDVILVQNPTGDPLIQNFSTSNFDMSLGVYAYSKTLFMGFSSNQIFDSNLNYSIADGIVTDGKVNRNYNFLLGGRISLDREWQIIPSVLLKSVSNSPVQWDLNTKAIYDNRFWFGGSYRHEESFYALAGFRFWNSLSVSYSYDFPISRIRNIQSGTHEIILSYRFSGKNGGGKKCYCPAYSM